MLGVHCFVLLLRVARLCDWAAQVTHHLMMLLNFRIGPTTVALAKSTRDSSFVELLTSAHCTIGPVYVKTQTQTHDSQQQLSNERLAVVAEMINGVLLLRIMWLFDLKWTIRVIYFGPQLNKSRDVC